VLVPRAAVAHKSLLHPYMKKSRHKWAVVTETSQISRGASATSLASEPAFRFRAGKRGLERAERKMPLGGEGQSSHQRWVRYSAVSRYQDQSSPILASCSRGPMITETASHTDSVATNWLACEAAMGAPWAARQYEFADH
jgi:hypothetical protein